MSKKTQMALTDADRRTLNECWRRSPGKAWEPRGGTDTPIIRRFVAAGYLRVVDGRCGFELLKDAMVTWTDAGRAALATGEAR